MRSRARKEGCPESAALERVFATGPFLRDTALMSSSHVELQTSGPLGEGAKLMAFILISKPERARYFYETNARPHLHEERRICVGV